LSKASVCLDGQRHIGLGAGDQDCDLFFRVLDQINDQISTIFSLIFLRRGRQRYSPEIICFK
jgi:hypothetical protein